MIDVQASSFPSSMEDSASSALPAVSSENSSDKNLQRAEGSCRIVLGGPKKSTRVMDVYQKSPIRVLFPKAFGTVREAVLVNTAGGVAGGDRLEVSVTATDDASVAVTTQTAEKIYRAINTSANIITTLKVCDDAKLAWLPQETIVFNQARVCRRTEIEVSSGSELLALEWLVLGRAAHGERMLAGSIRDTWLVKKDGRLVWGDTLRLTDDVFSHLSRKALLSESTALATLLYFGHDLEHHLQLIRDLSPSFDCQCGATLVGGLMVARFAAKSSFELKAALRTVLQELGKEIAHGPFRVPKMWSC